MDHHLPTLDLIDRALDDPSRRFSLAANAMVLERRARELASEYWSEFAWLTGAVGEPAFGRVVADLEAMRIDPLNHDGEVDVSLPVRAINFPEIDPEDRAA